MATMNLDAYIRVSQVGKRDGDSFISPEVQRDQIEGWAKLRGVTITAWHTDLDQSGGKLSRPGLDAMMARLRAGDTEGIAVAYLSRLSRASVVDALRLVEEITELGGKLAVVDLGVDPTTTFGEFAVTIMLALARMERRKLTENWAIAQGRAIGRGVAMGHAPFGYRRGDDGRLEADGWNAGIVADAYRVAGKRGIHAAVAYLKYAAPYGRQWSIGQWSIVNVRDMFARRVYLGEINHHPHTNANAHDPIVSLAVWEAAQSQPGGKRQPPG
jgi:DNA invertase Pin-like site-specific DNA recombinase